MTSNYLLIFPSPLGLGGTFLLKEGKARQHVMPDFSTTPLHTEDDVNSWLKFYNMSAPLIAVGTLVSADPVSICHASQTEVSHLQPQLSVPTVMSLN